jgi:carbamoyl-phosphate synthase large subunit
MVLNQIKEIIDIEKQITEKNIFENKNFLNYVKASGFSDKKISDIINKPVSDIVTKRNELGIVPVYKKVDTCAAEFNSVTPYMYSTYDVGFSGNRECESNPTEKEKIVIIGGGPNRIGQGIEFDYCCCQASYALSEIGYETIMINCNPETVSTDYDTSDRLYFEPLIEEYVLEILKKKILKVNLKELSFNLEVKHL